MTEFLRYQREEVDPEENRMTSPPEDERIEVRCIWLTEFYAPSHVPTLLSGLEKLGWRGRGGIREESLADLLRQERTRQFGRSAQIIGPVVRPDEERWSYLPERPETDLPDVVDYAFGSLYIVSSSLTALTMQFVLKGEAALSLDRVLRRTDFETRAVKRENGGQFGLDGSAYQKGHVVREERCGLREECAYWFAQNLSGVFHGGASTVPFPSCELVTLERVRPFEPFPSEDLRHLMHNYLQLLDLENDYGVWESPSLPGVKLRIPAGTRGGLADEEEFALTLAANVPAMREAKDLDSRGNEDGAQDDEESFGYTRELQLDIASLTLIWSLHALVSGYERQLSGIRDAAGAVDLGNLEKAARETRKLQTKLVEMDRDVIPVSAELKRLSESPEAFMWRYAAGFRRADAEERAARRWARKSLRERLLAKVKGGGSSDQEERSLLDNMRQSLLGRAARMRDLEPEVRQVVNATASLIGSITQERATEANLSLQKEVRLLTRAALAVAVLSLIVTGIQACTALSADQNQQALPQATEATVHKTREIP